MKKIYILLFTLLIFQTFFVLHAQETTISGAPKGYSPSFVNAIINTSQTDVQAAIDSTYRTSVFTFADIAIFSYFDSTHVTILQGATTLRSFSLKADSVATYTGSSGVYKIYGDKPFTVLIGDAITNFVNGYFAIDASGYGLSTKFNTWMMSSTNATFDPHFVIFGYQNGTQFTIRDLLTKQVIATGQLNDGQYYDFPNVSTISNKPLQVTATAPVSVLSYTDQDYYVPSSNGTFAGTLFYGFSGYSGAWNNSITVTSYTANNKVTVTNIKTGALISTYTLNEGQVYTDTIKSDIFWKVQSSGTVTVANIPFSTWTGSYYYLARAADRTGRNVGTLFYVPTISSRLDVFSFEDNNFVKITRLGQIEEYPYPAKIVIDSATLSAGNVRTISSTTSGRYVYKVEATKNVSVVQSNGGAGADFMPLNFALQLPDLAISSTDIKFNPPDSVYVSGDKITVTVTVKNQGAINANNITVTAYEGDPDAGGIAPTIGSKIISFIPFGGSTNISFEYVIPSNPQYRQIVVKVDPLNTITESNESNNKAAKSLKPNTDVLPPLSINVISPNGLLIDSLTSQLKPNPFKVEATIFNTGTVSALNAKVTLTLYNGLTLVAGPIDSTVANLPANGVLRFVWLVKANKDSTGLNLFTIRVGADNATAKNVNRAVNIPDIIPPLIPTGLAATPIAGGVFQISWNANTDKDLGGYKLFYNINDSAGYDGRGANEGNSPIIITQITAFRISGLLPRVRYKFALKAFDYSNNESNLSQPVSAISDEAAPIPVPQILSIKDVPNDNGKFVFVTWKVNRPAASNGISLFGIWRKDSVWSYVAESKVTNDTAYSVVAPTIFDSTKINGMYTTTYRVSAHSVLPEVFSVSLSANGYSLDNLPPLAPATPVANQVGKTNVWVISWKPAKNQYGDFKQYALYTGSDSNFVPNDSNRVLVNDTTFTVKLGKIGTYYYKISAVDYSGNESAPIRVKIDVITSVSLSGEQLPTEYLLSQNYPNPFNPSTTIAYDLPKNEFVILKVYDMLGREVTTLLHEEKSAGRYTSVWNASTVASGIYIAKITAGDFRKTIRMTLMK